MKNRFRRLFLLAVFASIGLLCLQLYWISREWSRSGDILQREVDYSFQQAVDREWSGRKDTLTAYLSYFLHDTSFIRVRTKYNEKHKVWAVEMYDPRNTRDYFSWSNPRLGLNGPASEAQQEMIIRRFINDNVKKSIATDVVFYYTQRFGKIWMDKYQALNMDTGLVAKLFREELAKNSIDATFSIAYADTSLHQQLPGKKKRSLLTKPALVNYDQVNDPDKKFITQATVNSPGMVVFKRMWLIIAGSLLMLALAFISLYKMYRTILRQKQLDELKDDFISNMTHELKTPIATVTAAVDGLQYYEAMEDRQRANRYLETSRKELKRLDDLVSKVLELSLDQQLNEQLRTEKFSLKEFLEQILSSFKLHSGVEWTLNMDDNLRISGDRQRLQSVFQNLIENAIKYGRADTKLNITSREDNGWVKIIFSDNGPGIDAAFLPSVFNKFYRVPSGDKRVKGFGLGLFHVRQIITAHGGTITAESSNGLSFIINIPSHH